MALYKPWCWNYHFSFLQCLIQQRNRAGFLWSPGTSRDNWASLWVIRASITWEEEKQSLKLVGMPFCYPAYQCHLILSALAGWWWMAAPYMEIVAAETDLYAQECLQTPFLASLFTPWNKGWQGFGSVGEGHWPLSYKFMWSNDNNLGCLWSWEKKIAYLCFLVQPLAPEPCSSGHICISESDV